MRALKIIYEDDWLMVVDKPSGMLTIPTSKKEKNTLTDILNHELDKRGVEVNAYPCHRLDRETTGLIVYAKGKKVQRLMMGKFKNRFVEKTYLAFAHGVMEKGSGIIQKSIYNRNRRREEPAITRYKVLERRKDFSVLEIVPVTGRTNQIRIHLKYIGHPVVGESVYAFRRDFKLRFRRTALHAKKIAFDHPITGEKIVLDSPLAADMAGLIAKN